MKEIGGYLELEHFKNGEYHAEALRLNSVRNAIVLIMQERGYHKLWIPHYLCSSVRKMLETRQFEYDYYSIDDRFLPILESKFSGKEAVLIVNFFGQLDNERLAGLIDRYQNVIIDNTHAFFQKPLTAADTVYTCRKYFGVPDGAYAYIPGGCAKYAELRTDQSYTRMEHILGRFENTAAEFYNKFSENDHLLEQIPILKMSKLTQNLLNAIDYESIQQRRKKNFEILDANLSSINLMQVSNYGGCYMYPLLLKNGHRIKQELIQQKIYVPTLWPNVLEETTPDTWEYFLTDNLVLLPIDQRYSETDMKYILKVLTQILGGEANAY